MEVRLEHTDGLGRRADVWIGGALLTVCDAFSPAGRPSAAGALEDVKLSYASMEGFSWRRALRGNPDGARRLDPMRGWSYVGYGRILSVMPTVIDFGLMQMEDANWTGDEGLVGRCVRIAIDRLEVSTAHAPDWPEQAQ